MIKPDSIHIIGIATKFEMDRAGMAILNKAVQFLKKKGDFSARQYRFAA